MKRALLGVLAAIMVVVGGSLLAVAGWIYAAFGTNGIASASLGEIRSAPTSSAVVIDVDSAQVRIPWLAVHGTTTLHLDAFENDGVLAGTSDATTVDSFLGTHEFDAAYRADGTWNLTHVPGSPTAESWPTVPEWLSSGASVDIRVRDGHTVMIANPDGTPGVGVNASLQFSVPRAPQSALALALSGGVLALAGLALAFSVIWLMKRRPDEHVT